MHLFLNIFYFQDGSRLLTNKTCHTPIPSNLTLYMGNIEIEYNKKYKLYKITGNCAQTTMSAVTQVYIHLDDNLDVCIANIETNINQISSTQTELQVYWDGKIASFEAVGIEGNWSGIFSTATIEYYFNSNTKYDVPVGYTVKYPVITSNIFMDQDMIYFSNARGYLEVDVFLGIEVTNPSFVYNILHI